MPLSSRALLSYDATGTPRAAIVSPGRLVKSSLTPAALTAGSPPHISDPTIEAIQLPSTSPTYYGLQSSPAPGSCAYEQSSPPSITALTISPGRSEGRRRSWGGGSSNSSSRGACDHDSALQSGFHSSAPTPHDNFPVAGGGVYYGDVADGGRGGQAATPSQWLLHSADATLMATQTTSGQQQHQQHHHQRHTVSFAETVGEGESGTDTFPTSSSAAEVISKPEDRYSLAVPPLDTTPSGSTTAKLGSTSNGTRVDRPLSGGVVLTRTTAVSGAVTPASASRPSSATNVSHGVDDDEDVDEEALVAHAVSASVERTNGGVSGAAGRPGAARWGWAET